MRVGEHACRNVFYSSGHRIGFALVLVLFLVLVLGSGCGVAVGFVMAVDWILFVLVFVCFRLSSLELILIYFVWLG